MTIEEVLYIHFQIMSEIHGEAAHAGLLKPKELQSAVLRPLQSAGGTDAYPDDFAKAAALTHSIIKGHPFGDGNKRVGITAGCVFLLVNGYQMLADDDDIYSTAITSKPAWSNGRVCLRAPAPKSSTRV